MPQDHILRLRRTDADGEHLLINITQSGSKPLDLKLVASEGEHVYPAKIKESNVKTLQASNYSGDLEEWQVILKYALLQQHPTSPLPESLQGVEAVAAISGETLTINLRKNIGGIHQRLGSIKLEQNDEEEINPFDWAGTAVTAADELREQLETLQASVSAQQGQVAKLNRQLDDLVKAKKEHEEELLKKFAALLNAKKLKIRDQQRLLSGAKIDPEAAEVVSDSRSGGGKARKPTPSRKGKRKANGTAEPEPEPAEAAANDEETATEDDDDALIRREETPQNSDRDATEDEDSDADGFNAAPAASQQSRRGVGNRGKALEVAKEKATGGSAMEVDDAGSPPPRRELPFAKKKAEETKKPAPAPAPVQEEDDDETDDDEL